jgi:hypothetical protein
LAAALEPGPTHGGGRRAGSRDEPPLRPQAEEGDEPEQDLAIELADVLFVLLVIANEQGIDLEDALERVLEKYRSRDGERWTRVRP